eukprot:TRINITY_DN23259_c0_g1_i1.p1 TRINITY_DN23259_c0_g1~~TRINITY_DN23259_c0_g1_i1.p1  ORF type:complete len:137 (-),score=0.75 TRINITY_DN23259_c0_g1_i1:18-428(-)
MLMHDLDVIDVDKRSVCAYSAAAAAGTGPSAASSKWRSTRRRRRSHTQQGSGAPALATEGTTTSFLLEPHDLFWQRLTWRAVDQRILDRMTRGLTDVSDSDLREQPSRGSTSSGLPSPADVTTALLGHGLRQLQLN